MLIRFSLKSALSDVTVATPAVDSFSLLGRLILGHWLLAMVFLCQINLVFGDIR